MTFLLAVGILLKEIASRVVLNSCEEMIRNFRGDLKTFCHNALLRNDHYFRIKCKFNRCTQKIICKRRIDLGERIRLKYKQNALESRRKLFVFKCLYNLYITKQIFAKSGNSGKKSVNYIRQFRTNVDSTHLPSFEYIFA